jgi:NAD(P)-dependent dehydrogenase (short-subunit alcohol dehydrogenase family)
MLRGKRAVITGGGGDLVRRFASGWREGVDVDFSARRVEDIEKPAPSSRLKGVWQEGISAI